MPISFLQELENLKSKSFSILHKETVKELIKMTDNLAQERIEKNALREGKKIPEFELKDTQDNTVSSSQLLQNTLWL